MWEWGMNMLRCELSLPMLFSYVLNGSPYCVYSFGANSKYIKGAKRYLKVI